MISVVIPTYNREAVIARAADSVIGQTYQNWELLIIDDGSSDNTKKIIREQYCNDPRIDFIERPKSRQKGANACRNIGIERAQGTYIAFLDSDDEWRESHLEKCYVYAENWENFTGSYSSGYIRKGPVLNLRESREKGADESHFDFLLSAFAQTSTFFLKNDPAKYVKFDESLLRHQDWDFYIRFGKTFGWFFNPSAEAVIHRNLRYELQTIHFDSCIKFYEKFKDDLCVKRAETNYILQMLHKAVYAKNETGKRYYYQKLYGDERSSKTVLKYYGSYIFFRLKNSYLFSFLQVLMVKLSHNKQKNS